MSEAIQKFVSVPFMGTTIQATADDRHLVALKPLIEGIGFDWSKVFLKVKKTKALSSVVAMVATTGADGKTYEMTCLPLNRLNGLLFSINPEDYNHNPELKARLEKYQELCYDALYQYFQNGVAVHPAMALATPEEQAASFQKALDSAVKHAMEMADNWYMPKLEKAESERDEAIRTKAWISDKKTATALQRNSVLSRKINELEAEKQELIDEYDTEIDGLKAKLIPAEEYSDRYWSWRRKVGRPRKGYVRPEDDLTDPLF